MLAVITMLLSACAQKAPVIRPLPPPEPVKIIELPKTSPEVEPDVTDLMADMKGDKMLPPVAGEVEQIDCKDGVEDLHARMAVEAHGGQIASFAYYSKWRPRTCSLEMKRDNPEIKWRLTADGATRVQTPHGMFLIRIKPDAYVFEFKDVERRKFCGMEGHTNGTMMISRGSTKPECTVAGLLDRDEVPVLSEPGRYSVVTTAEERLRP